MSRAASIGGFPMKLIAGAALTALLFASASQAAIHKVAAGKDAQERLQSALIDAKPGDTVLIGPGKFELTDGLSLDVKNVTVKGSGQDKTILDFHGQMAAGEGLMITSNGVTVRDLTVIDAKGDAVKAKGVDQISFIDMKVDWSGPPKAGNGAYGVYPVSSTNVLIDGVTVRGASDAGIYVGQSKNIVVKRSKAEFNVAGIEIENSMNADVHDNLSTHNAGGILIFDLPNLPQQGGHSHRIFHNRIVDNDTQNFAPKGNIVASVPTGTGVLVMANHDIHVFDNTIAGNASVAIMLIGYKREIKDAKYEALPTDVVIRDNKIGRNGWDPQIDGMKGLSLPPVLWDGATHFVRNGEPQDRAVNVVIKDGPVLNLHLADITDMATAKPKPVPNVEGKPVDEPKPVVLPATQARLSKK
jgi:parallel beta-helix repeat protein